MSKGWFEHYKLAYELERLAMSIFICAITDVRSLAPLVLVVPLTLMALKSQEKENIKRVKVREGAETAWMATIEQVMDSKYLIDSCGDLEGDGGLSLRGSRGGKS